MTTDLLAAEFRQALRALLQRPLLRAPDDAALLTLVRRHAEALRVWLARWPGWVLIVEAGCARLLANPAAAGPDHPARDRNGQAFTRRRYVLVCLAIAACERAGRQITLGRLAESLQIALAGDPALVAAGLGLDPQRREDRADLVATGRLLVELGVIERIHGDEEQWLGERGDCLYTIQRQVLARVPAWRRGPSQIEATEADERLHLLQAEPEPEGDEGRRRILRQTLVRRLLCEPVLLYADLTAEELAYLSNQRQRLMNTLCEATGLHAEVRAEGIALVDPEGGLCDFRLPQEGTLGHAALLLAAWLTERLRSEPDLCLGCDEVVAAVAGWATEHGSRWRADARSAAGAAVLADTLIERFCALGLLRRDGQALRPLPPVARYALAAPDDSGAEASPQPVQATLFGEQL